MNILVAMLNKKIDIYKKELNEPNCDKKLINKQIKRCEKLIKEQYQMSGVNR